MSLIKMPDAAAPENIGKVVSIQVFKRTRKDGDTLEQESLQKHVGKLQAYWYTKGIFMFQLEGSTREAFSLSTHYVEIFPYYTQGPKVE